MKFGTAHWMKGFGVPLTFPNLMLSSVVKTRLMSLSTPAGKMECKCRKSKLDVFYLHCHDCVLNTNHTLAASQTAYWTIFGTHNAEFCNLIT